MPRLLTGFDLYFEELQKLIEDCSYSSIGSCEYCSVNVECAKWWDILSGRLEDRIMKVDDYRIYLVEFAEIKRNGDKGNVYSKSIGKTRATV